MRLLLTCCLAISLTSVHARATADTSIRGVTIYFDRFKAIFPSFWYTEPINGRCVQMSPGEIARSKSIMAKALQKYPATVITANVKSVYFLAEMSFYGVNFGATNSTDLLYLSNCGTVKGYTDLYLEQSFHHEFSSILLRNYKDKFDEAAWLKATDPEQDYNDPEMGTGAIRNNRSSQALDRSLCQHGYLTEYSLSSLENDVNTVAQNMFSPSTGFWDLVDEFPLIAAKVKILVDLYHAIDPLFTISYFRNLK